MSLKASYDKTKCTWSTELTLTLLWQLHNKASYKSLICWNNISNRSDKISGTRICADGSRANPYCAYGSCNTSGCQCSGGCRHGWHVILFEHKDFQGRRTVVRGEGRCWNLDPSFNDITSAVNTRGNCVRLYEHKDCGGAYIELKPGTGSHNWVGDHWNDRISSVRSCWPDKNRQSIHEISILYQLMVISIHSVPVHGCSWLFLDSSFFLFRIKNSRTHLFSNKMS